MLEVVLGITIGGGVGCVENWLLFRLLDRHLTNRHQLTRFQRAFGIRYLVDAAILVVMWLLLRNTAGILAAGIGLLAAVQVSLLLTLRRRGGRLE